MDFYNLQESDHRLIEQAIIPFFNFERVLDKKNILLAEEDPRIQLAMRNHIRAANQEAACHTVNSLDEVSRALREKEYDLLIANYYLSEDEIDYEYWENLRSCYPKMEIIILSHINDREYYTMLEKNIDRESLPPVLPMSVKIKNFFGNVFGG